MAKKYRKSKLVFITNPIVHYLYSRGVLHSLVCHLILLLYLAMLFPCSIKTQKLKPIAINFLSQNELTEPDTETFTDLSEIKINEPNEVSDPEASSVEIGISSISTLTESSHELSDSVNTEFIDTPVSSTSILDLTIDDLSVKIEPPKPKELKVARTSKFSNASNTQGQNLSTQLTNNLSDKAYEGEIKQRLQEYGAKTGDIQISLSWNSIDDLDLHVSVQPINSNINWMSRVGSCGGELDIDMNFDPSRLTNRPIENVFWGPGLAPHGKYIIGVHYYMSWSRNREVEGVIRIKDRNEVKTLPFVVRYGEPVKIITVLNH